MDRKIGIETSKFGIYFFSDSTLLERPWNLGKLKLCLRPTHLPSLCNDRDSTAQPQRLSLHPFLADNLQGRIPSHSLSFFFFISVHSLSCVLFRNHFQGPLSCPLT